MTMDLQGTQLDIQTALVGQSLTYLHYYEVKALIFGNDLEVNTTYSGTCDPNPCQNDGTCQIGLAQDFRCSCPENYIGKINKYIPY